MPVIIDGDQFIANHVPLTQGENTLTATDASGLTISDSITVGAQMPEDYIRLTATPASGTSPFETTLRIDSSFAVTSVQVACFEPDGVTYLDQSTDEIRLQVTTEGVHTFAVEATDSEGNVYTDEVSIEVVDKAALDALLQDQWEAMRQALIDGNIQTAAMYFKSNRVAAYSELFQHIPRDRISDLIPMLDKMELVEVLEGKVRYVTIIDIVVNGALEKTSSYIIFVQDDSGLWKISFF